VDGVDKWPRRCLLRRCVGIFFLQRAGPGMAQQQVDTCRQDCRQELRAFGGAVVLAMLCCALALAVAAANLAIFVGADGFAGLLP
jgi:uncharacterized protein (DUF2062 family)